MELLLNEAISDFVYLVAFSAMGLGAVMLGGMYLWMKLGGHK